MKAVEIQITGHALRHRGDPTVNPIDRTGPLPISEQQFLVDDAVRGLIDALNRKIADAEKLGLTVAFLPVP